MARRSSSARIIRFPAPRAAAPVIIRQTRTVKAKKKHRRRGGGGSSRSSIETMLKGAIATKVGGSVVLGMLPSGMRLMNDDVTLAVLAHYGHADKYVRGVQSWTTFKAIDSVLSAGGLLDIFHKG